ncbi:MAG: hypothetical protein PSX71_14525 [bacterium]|nr:hypothetical protein [bacterium]
MKKYHSKNIHTLLVLLGVCLLVSCGETTNLKDPINSAVTTLCSDLGEVCVNGRFIDDAVFNLDYECGKVVARTGSDGSFSCPINSTITFLIKNPSDSSASAKKITLGQSLVKNTANLGSNLPTFLYITPATLATDPIAQKNIVRLLQALSDDPTPADLTSHIVYISDETKKELTRLDREITPADFLLPISIAVPATPTSPAVPSASGSFDALMEPLLGAPVFSPSKSPMISAAKADEYLQRGINSIFAGVYTDFGILSVFGLPISVPSMTGYNSTKNMTASMWSVVDRKGRIMGAGVYSYENASTGQLLSTNPKPMELTAFGSAGGIPKWPNSGNLQGMLFNMMDQANATTSMKLGITQGVMEREAIAGNDTLYKQLFDEPTAPSGRLGQWEVNDAITSGNNIAASTTEFTMLHSGPAAPSLNPDLWQAIAFPLHVALRFWNDDPTTPPALPASGCDLSGCPIGPSIRISILQDGNIISDLKGDCSEVNPVTLMHVSGPTAGDQELPLGLVQNIFKSTPSDQPASATFMTLALILPNKPLVASSTPGDDQEKYLRYAQLLTNLGGPTVLRVDGAGVNADYLKLHSIVTVTQTDGSSVSTYDPTTAEWTNIWTILRGINSLNNDPVATPPETGHVASGATKTLQKNQQGFVRSAPVICP